MGLRHLLVLEVGSARPCGILTRHDLAEGTPLAAPPPVRGNTAGSGSHGGSGSHHHAHPTPVGRRGRLAAVPPGPEASLPPSLVPSMTPWRRRQVSTEHSESDYAEDQSGEDSSDVREQLQHWRDDAPQTREQARTLD